MNTFAIIALAIACVLVLAECALFARNRSHLRSLIDTHSPEPTQWPLVSVIIAGRDEALTVGAALTSRLADDYPALEIIFVDDRSSDQTTAAALKVAGEDPRLRMVRVDDLPAGWLGKVHALARGTELANGTWLLFSDADVEVSPDALRRAVSYVIEHDFDMLALVPAYRTGSFAVDSIWAVFMRILAMVMDPAKVRDPRSKAAIGSGAFNLVSREAFERTPGFEHIRLETGDDAALGQMIKQAGGGIEMIDGRGCASVAVYRSVPDLVRGIEKNGSTMVDKPFPLVLMGFAVWTAIELAPLAGVVAWSVGAAPLWLGALAAIALTLNTATYAFALWTNTRTWAAALVWPLGMVVFAFAIIRSVHLAHAQGGVYWRGTFYSLAELRVGRRYEV